MTRTFSLVFLFAWALTIFGYQYAMLAVPPTMLLVNLISDKIYNENVNLLGWILFIISAISFIIAVWRVFL